jgi:hypothetical protein
MFIAMDTLFAFALLIGAQSRAGFEMALLKELGQLFHKAVSINISLLTERQSPTK